MSKEELGNEEEFAAQENYQEPTQEEIAQELEAEISQKGGGEKPAENIEDSGNPLSEDEVSVYNDFLGKEIDESFYKNEDGTSKSKTEVLKGLNNSIAEKSKLDLANDPFIANYLSAKKEEGFSQKEFINTLTKSNAIANLDSKTFLREYYKGKGYKEDQISNFITQKTDIELDELSNKGKQEIIRKEQDNLASNFKKVVSSRKQEILRDNTLIHEAIDTFVNDDIKSGTFPLKFTESELKEITPIMKELASVELVQKENGIVEVSKLDTFLSDNDKFKKVLPFIAMVENGTFDTFMKSYIKNVKSDEFDKIENNTSMGSGGSSGGFNPMKFMGKS